MICSNTCSRLNRCGYCIYLLGVYHGTSKLMAFSAAEMYKSYGVGLKVLKALKNTFLNSNGTVNLLLSHLSTLSK